MNQMTPGLLLRLLNATLSPSTAAPAAYDWDAAAIELRYVRPRVVAPSGGWAGSRYYYHHHHHHHYGYYRSEYDWDPAAGMPSWEDLTAWMWTTETAVAFGLLLVALALFMCCWISQKLGEALCFALAVVTATAVLLVVGTVFLSQWT